MTFDQPASTRITNHVDRTVYAYLMSLVNADPGASPSATRWRIVFSIAEAAIELRMDPQLLRASIARLKAIGCVSHGIVADPRTVLLEVWP